MLSSKIHTNYSGQKKQIHFYCFDNNSDNLHTAAF